MYETRFNRKNGQAEMFHYNSVAEAESHMKLFQNDDSGLYRNIAVFDIKQNAVLCILIFDKNGKPTHTFYHGQQVRLNPDFAKPEELKYVYRITNLNDITERAYITCENSSMTLKPTQLVGLEMILPIS